MHLLGYIVLSIAKILRLLINLYTFIVALAVLISWVNPDPYNPIVRFLYDATSPVLRRIRRLVPAPLLRFRFDITPIFLFILLILIDTIFVGLLFEVANSLVSK